MKCIEKLKDTIEYKRNMKRLNALVKQKEKIAFPKDTASIDLFLQYDHALCRVCDDLRAYQRKYFSYLEDPE